MSAGAPAPEWARGSPSAFSGPRRILVPQARTLVTFDGATTGTKTVGFRVPVPDARLIVKLSLLGIPTGVAAANFLTAKNVSLWLRGAEEAIQGGNIVSVTDLDVGGTTSTASAPVTIPVDSGLAGFSKELISSIDEVDGTLTVVGVANAVTGQLQLQCRYQPAPGQLFGQEEWDEIRRLCNPERVGPVLVIG